MGEFGVSDFFMFGSIPVWEKKTGIPMYDFPFRNIFSCRSIIDRVEQPVLLRIGAIRSYKEIASLLGKQGCNLLFTEQEHDRASQLENWYPLLIPYTPFSIVYSQFPSLEMVLQDFEFPIFVKGNRQTNRHNKKQSIIRNADMFQTLANDWNKDTYLHWQKVVVREYIPLEVIDDSSYPDMIPFSYEFRIFFWKQQIVGYGKYWCLGRDYVLLEEEKEQAFGIAEKAARRVNVPFLTVDIAKTHRNEWIVIEVNDGQESGYAGVNPVTLWENILNVERMK